MAGAGFCAGEERKRRSAAAICIHQEELDEGKKIVCRYGQTYEKKWVKNRGNGSSYFKAVEIGGKTNIV